MFRCAFVCFICLVTASCVSCEQTEDAKSPLEDDHDPIKKYPAAFVKAFPSCMGSAVRLARAYTTEGIVMRELQKSMLRRETKANYFASDTDIELKGLMMRNSRSRLLENSTAASKNLIDTLRFTRRASKFTNHIIELVNHEASQSGVEFYTRLNHLIRKYIANIGCWISAEDHNTAVHNFLRVVRVYNLSREEVTKGTILKVKSKTALSPKELRYILLKSHELNSYEDVVDWSKFLIDQNYDELKDQALTFRRLHYNALFKIGKIQEAIEFMEKMAKDGFQDKKLDRNLAFYRDRLTSGRIGSEVEKSADVRTFEKLCGGDFHGNAQNSFCKWLSPMNGWLRFKMEVFSRSPFICRIYDVVNASDSEILRRVSMTHMLMHSRYDPIERPNPWASDNIFELEEIAAAAPIFRLRKRLSWISGLDATLNSGMDFVVATEPLGGSFQPRTDFFKEQRWKNEALPYDIMVTAAFQFSEDFNDTKIIFPKAKVAVKNYPGAVTLWFNLHRSGSPDSRSLYATCPVPHGVTWTAMLKILTTNHMTKRPCGLKKDH